MANTSWDWPEMELGLDERNELEGKRELLLELGMNGAELNGELEITTA